VGMDKKGAIMKALELAKEANLPIREVKEIYVAKEGRVWHIVLETVREDGLIATIDSETGACLLWSLIG